MARVELQAPDRHSRMPATIDENAETGWSFKRTLDALNDMLVELYAGIAGAEAFVVSADAVAADRPLVLPSYTVATLPDPVAGAMIYVADGAAGDPVQAFCDGTYWLRCDTRAAVTAA